MDDLDDDILEKYSRGRRGGPRSEWDEAVDAFYQRINTPAGVKQYGEMTRPHIAKGLKGKTPLAISQLFKQCKGARSFGALFRHLTNV